MTIYAFQASDHEEHRQFVWKSLREDGISRFGWSWSDEADLRVMDNKSWDEFTGSDWEFWKPSHFLLEIEEGDWVVHVNIPHKNNAIAGQVIKGYEFDKDNEIGDFRHKITLDKSTIIAFDRNDPLIHPYVSAKLKLRSRFWRPRNIEEYFMESIEKVRSNRANNEGTKVEGENISKELYHLRKDMRNYYKEMTQKIHETHPNKKLEGLLCNVFRSIPGVTNARVNGSGWKSDYGADIIINYSSGLKIPGFDLNTEIEETMVVQVKSYEGHHSDTKALQQIEQAIEKFDARMGMIITTGECDKEMRKKIEEASDKIDKPIFLISGADVARFVLENMEKIYEGGP